MSSEIKVTIAIPVVKNYSFKRALESAINQKFDDYEIIILNNAGNTKVKEEIKAIYVESLKQNANVLIRYIENQYQLPMIKNWNKALASSRGEYFTLLCDDDYYDLNYLTKMYSLAKKYLDISIFHCRVIIKNGESFSLSSQCNEVESGYDFIYHRIKRIRQQYLSDFFLKKEKLVEIGGFVDMEHGYGSDDLTWFKLALDSGIGYCKEPLYYYENHISNISNISNIKPKKLALKKYIIVLKKIIARNKKLNFTDNLLIEMINEEIPNYYYENLFAIYRRKINNLKAPNIFKNYLIFIYKIKCIILKQYKIGYDNKSIN